jgi:hypothetical protein
LSSAGAEEDELLGSCGLLQPAGVLAGEAKGRVRSALSVEGEYQKPAPPGKKQTPPLAFHGMDRMDETDKVFT